MKPKSKRRLKLQRETVRNLSKVELARAAGGIRPLSRSCLSGCNDTYLTRIC